MQIIVIELKTLQQKSVEKMKSLLVINQKGGHWLTIVDKGTSVTICSGNLVIQNKSLSFIYLS